jgi:hypothetical protein
MIYTDAEIKSIDVGDDSVSESDSNQHSRRTVAEYGNDNDEQPCCAPAPYSILPTDEERDIIIEEALAEIIDIMKDNALEYKREDFSKDTVEDLIDGYLCNHFAEIGAYRSNYSYATSLEASALNDVMDRFIQEIADDIADRFYEDVAPPRSCTESFINEHACITNASGASEGCENVEFISAKLKILSAKPQPEQRTPEWYARRNNLITASAASKAFGTPASVNQLIYEKCKNYSPPCLSSISKLDQYSSANIDDDDMGLEHNSNHNDTTISETHKIIITAPPQPQQHQQQHVSVNSPLHWGQRYEPITVMLYEHRNATKLGEFGCIVHDTYSFLGASPDGINIDPMSPLFGRMVEIKNIVNREITGIPKEEYWIQTQIQMEVCDIDDCDFVETRFKEYEDEDAFLADSPSISESNTASYSFTSKNMEKGIILWFQPQPTKKPDGSGVIYSMPLYEYAPIDITREEYEIWEQEIFAKHEKAGNFWTKNIYWYVDQYSCVLILRNRLWFQAAIPVLQQVWTTIEKERKIGFNHRAPKKKTKVTNASASMTGSSSTNMEIMNIVKLDLTISSSVLEPPDNANVSIHINKTSNSTMRPSDVLIKCFKIDNLDMDIDENKNE